MGLGLNRIFWGNISQGDVYSGPETIPSGETANNRTDLDVIVPFGNPVSDQSRSFHFNSLTKQLFWTDDVAGQIITSDAEGSGVTVIASGLGTGIRDLITHEASGHVYFTDITADDITRMDLDGSNQTVVATGVVDAWGLAFDEISETLFWTELTTGKIVSSGLGSGFTTILKTVDTGVLVGITVDGKNDRLYWVEFGNDTVNRTSLDGTLATQVVLASGNGLTDVAIDITRQNLYVTEQQSPKTLRKIALDIVGQNDIAADWVADGTGAQNSAYGIAFGILTTSVDLIIPLSINVTPKPAVNNSPLFIKGPVVINANTPVFLQASVTSDDFDWTFEDFVGVDGFVPNIIGNLEGATGPVTIQVWENTSSGVVLLSLVSDVCTQIGSTGRWGWSTSNLPTTSNKVPSYVFTMTPTTGAAIFGEFRLRKTGQQRSMGDLDNSLGTIL